jgi:hypothetical protein
MLVSGEMTHDKAKKSLNRFNIHQRASEERSLSLSLPLPPSVSRVATKREKLTVMLPERRGSAASKIVERNFVLFIL